MNIRMPVRAAIIGGLFLISTMTFAAASPGAPATLVPGAHVPTLGRSVVGPSDLRSLRLAVELNSAELRAAHERLQMHQERMRELERELRVELAALSPEGAADGQDTQLARRARLEQVRDDIERRRREGEFRGNPGAAKEALQEAMLEAQQEIDHGEGQLAMLKGWGEAFERQAKVLEAWGEQIDVLEAQTHEAIKQVVGEEQADAVDAWWLDRQLARAIRGSRLSGESVDPVRLLEQSGREIAPATREAIATWKQSHAKVTERRREAIWAVPAASGRTVSVGRIGPMEAAVDDVMDARRAVRDSSSDLVIVIAGTMSETEAALWTESASRRAFPATWRSDRASRAMSSVLQRSDLDAAQRVIVEQILASHDLWVEGQRPDHIDAIKRDEPSLLMYQDLAAVRPYLGSEKSDLPKQSRLKAIKASQARANAEAMSELRSVLTDAQWASVPGTATEFRRD